MEENMVWIFPEATRYITSSQHLSTLRVMLRLVGMTERNQMLIVFSTKTRGELSEVCNLSGTSVLGALQELERDNVVKRTANNTYLLNPELFWNGDLCRRHKMIQKYQQYQ